jgi:hypothetical protein
MNARKKNIRWTQSSECSFPDQNNLRYLESGGTDPLNT